MSTHLLIAAAYLEDLPQGTKLVLMAAADSADEHTLDAAPGLPKLRAWSGLSKSQVLRVLGTLIDDRYLERVEAGRAGRRAVYRVFPDGVPAIPHPDEVAARYDETAGSHPRDPNELSTGRPPASHQGRTDATLRVASEPIRVAPVRPLQSSTSVSSARGSGFPGARPPAGTTTNNPGPPCPLHPRERVPCPACKAAAVPAPPRPTTATEETRPA